MPIKSRKNHLLDFNLLLSFIVAIIFFLSLNSCQKQSSTQTVNQEAYNAALDSANHLYDSGKHEASIRYIEAHTPDLSALSLPQKAEFYSLHYNYNYHILKNNKAAIAYADNMLRLFVTPQSKSTYNELYSKAYFYKGDALFNENRYNEAYFYFYQGKKVAAPTSKQHECMLSDYSYRMGMILYKQEHYRLAAHYFQNSFDESGNCTPSFKSFYRQQEVLSNTGISYHRAGEPDSADTYFNLALDFINKHNRAYADESNALDVARAVIYGNKASVYLEKKRFNQAIVLLKKSIAINNKKGNDNNDALLSELKLAHVYLEQEHTDSLLLTLKRIKNRPDSLKNGMAKADWHLLTANYFEQTGNIGQALSYFKAYDHYKDSANVKLLALKETDISEQLKRFERDHELNQLKEANRDKNIYLILAGVFVLMAMLLMVLIYKYWRKSKSNVFVLHNLNQRINEQNLILEHTLNDLKTSSEEKDRILRAVAHDLRNPIGGIASLTNAIVDDEGYTDDQKACLTLIKDTAYNSIELINEILEATNNNQEVLNKQWVDINDLLSHSVELLRFKAAEKNQTINLSVLYNAQQLWISREKIWRVVSNLVSNAIKFSPVGAVIEAGITDNDDSIVIAVKDNGIGIPDNLRPYIFNMFTEAKRPGTLGEKSFGLGLSISRQIIEKHNGKIWFESSPHQGTTFYIQLHKTIQNIVPESLSGAAYSR